MIPKECKRLAEADFPIAEIGMKDARVGQMIFSYCGAVVLLETKHPVILRLEN